MTTFAIRAIAARAVAPFVSTEQTRTYLTGISIEPAAGGGAIAVGLDSRTMGIYRDAAGYADGKVIIRLADLMTALKDKPSWHQAIWLVGIDGKVAVVEAPDDGSTGASDAIGLHRAGKLRILATGGRNTVVDGTYPDWRRIVSSVGEQEPLSAGLTYNPTYLKRFADVGKLFQTGRSMPPMQITPNNSSGFCFVSYRDDKSFLGMIAPMVDCAAWVRPDWLAYAPEPESNVVQLAATA